MIAVCVCVCVVKYVVWVAYRMRKEEESEKVQTGIPVVLLNPSIIKANTRRIKSRRTSALGTCDSSGLICCCVEKSHQWFFCG